MKSSLWLAFGALFFYGCINNPFGANDIARDKRTIKGQVAINSETSPGRALVWLEAFDLLTRTDARGYFDITLPDQFTALTNTGPSGSYNLYCYLANFSLGRTSIAIRNGKLTMPERLMTSDGVLRDPVVLSQKLEIETRIQPEVASVSKINVSEGLTDFVVRVDVTVQAFQESVEIFFPPIVNGLYGPLLFRNLESNDVKVLFSTVATAVTHAYETVTTKPQLRTMVVPLFPNDLPIGEYEVIPYLFVIDETLPEGLRERLNPENYRPGPEYLDIPFIRTGEKRILRIIP